MADFYEQSIARNGNFMGRTLVQASGSIGGTRHVFVKLQGGAKNGLVFPTTGGYVVNPFKGNAKAFAGDLVEYSTDGKCKILKTYLVAADAAGTNVLIARDGYKHVPFVGDILMVAPATLTGTGTAVTVTAVEETTDATNGDVWKLTLSAALADAKKGTILVEAEKAGAGQTALVTNPNTFLACDYDFVYDPATGADGTNGARYLLTPCIANEDTKLYIDKMSPIPPAIKALNRSRIDGWFNL